MEILPELDIVKELTALHHQGYIETLREGNTGIGYTLETWLKIQENNLAEPDFKYKGIPIELKAQRKNTSSRVTLITKVPNWDPLSSKQILERFGYVDVKGRKALKITLVANKYNTKGFMLKVDKEKNRLDIIHKDFGVVSYFDIKELMDKIKAKIYDNLLLVIADNKRVNGKEHFRFDKAILLRNLSENNFEELLDKGIMVWEFRMHIKPSGVVRDHGPGFRISRLHIQKLYNDSDVIFDSSKLSEEQK